VNTYYNRTRQTRSIPTRLIREGKLHLLPIYYLGLTTTLGREAIENSGSYLFADHIYGNSPSGRYLVGHLLDYIFLRLKSARAFRARYLFARDEILRLVREKPGELDILAVPCGLARELFDVSAELTRSGPSRSVRFHGMDLDVSLIEDLRERSREVGAAISFTCGDAMSEPAYPPGLFDMIVSLGFTEFLEDESTEAFYRVCLSKLKPGGRLVTSGMRRHSLSDYLLRNVADLRTNYRTDQKLWERARRAGFTSIATYHDPTGIQTMLIGEKQN
jgi:SAM-dependent methyltransferase